jgi:hypothetical protein
MQIDELVGNPYEMVITDNLLIYCDSYEGLLLSVYDLNKNHFAGRYISQGNGPGEALPPLRLFSSDQNHEFYAYQPNKRTLSSVSIPDFRLTGIAQLTSNNTWRPRSLKKTKDFFMCLGDMDNGIFGIYDPNFNPVFEGGKFPFDGENRNRREAFLVYQGHLCTNPANNKFAFGCTYSDYLVFCEIQNNELVVLKEYFTKDANVITGSSTVNIDGQEGVMYSVSQKDDTVINYDSSFGSATYCYMLFSGQTVEERKERSSNGNFIVVFDWDGKYIRTFQSDHEIFNFYVDEDNSLIYAIVRGDDGEKHIAKFTF